MLAMRVVGAAAVVLAVSGFGVGSLTVGYELDRLRDAQATGDAFTQALTDEYRQIALFESEEMYDWGDAGYFARKGLRTAEGEVVPPENVEDWNLPEDAVADLSTARSELAAQLDAGARDRAPQLAARAQGRFDCWIEQQEENFQTDHIAACRSEFDAAMEELRTAMAPQPAEQPAPAPAPAPAPPPAAPESFVMFFEFDRADITPQAREVIDSAVQAGQRTNVEQYSITGHADRAGPPEYNTGLSLRRANAVRDALTSRGIAQDNVSVAGRGEAEPAVQTPDGVPEQANRRVELILLE